MATISGFVFEGGGIGSECFFIAIGLSDSFSFFGDGNFGGAAGTTAVELLLATNLLATGFFVLLETTPEDGAETIFLDFSLLFATCSGTAVFLVTAGSNGFCFDGLRGVAGDLTLADPVFVSVFLPATILDFAGFDAAFVETLTFVGLTTFTGFGELFEAVFETDAFVFESDDFIGVALAVAGAATFPLETFEAGAAGFSLAVLLILEVEGFCELFGLFFDALNGNSITGWTT